MERAGFFGASATATSGSRAADNGTTPETSSAARARAADSSQFHHSLRAPALRASLLGCASWEAWGCQMENTERGWTSGTGTSGTGKPTGPAPAPAGQGTDDIDEPFRRRMASLSLQLAARSTERALAVGAGSGSQAQQSIGTRGESRQVYLGQPIPRRPSFTLMLAFVLGAAASTATINAFQEMNPPPAPLPITTATKAALLPNPMPAVLPPPVVVDPAPAAQPLPVAAAPVMSSMPAPAIGTADQNELSTSEVSELQTLLESLGMRPGLVDGVPGPRTAAAIRRYEESKARPQTGNLDRELLKRLRQESN